MKNRATQIVGKLNELSQELMDLAVDDRAKREIKSMRTHMGFDEGGWVGHRTLDAMFEDGVFDEEDDEEE